MTSKSAMRSGIALVAMLLGTGAMVASAGAAVPLINPFVKNASAPLVPGRSPAPVVPAKSVPLVPSVVKSKAPAPTLPTSKSPTPLVSAKGVPQAPSVVTSKPPAKAPATVTPSKPGVQIGAAATSRTYQIGFNGQIDTATEVTVQPTATTRGSITTTYRDPSGKVVHTQTTVCPIGWACGAAPLSAVLAANPSWSVPAAVPAPVKPASPAPSPTAGGIVGEAATLGITPAQLQILISGPKKGDPTVITIPNEHIAQPSGVSCPRGVVATYGGNPAVNPGGTLNGRPYTGPAGVVGSWVSTCA